MFEVMKSKVKRKLTSVAVFICSTVLIVGAIISAFAENKKNNSKSSSLFTKDFLYPIDIDEPYKHDPKLGRTTPGQRITIKAANMMSDMIANNWTYSQGNFVPMKDNEKKKGKYVDCSSFVCWVLYELGWEDCQSGGWQLNTRSFPGWFEEKGWKKITDETSLVSGDILMYEGHMEIFAYRKDNQTYVVNAGYDPSDHSSTYTKMSKAFKYAYRVPESN